MKKTIIKILYGMTVLLMLVGCGKREAQEILLQESTAEEAVKETKENAPADSESETTPVVQVECHCQCQIGASGGKDTPSAGLQEEGQAPVSEGKVNINTADLAQLQTLNGIGEVRARAIISYRETYGAFQSIEEIKNVSGIKDAVFNKIKDDISVG